MKAERPDFFSIPPFILNRVIVGMYFMDFCDDGSRLSYLPMDNFIEKLAREKGKTIMSLDDSQSKILMDNSSRANDKENREYASYVTELMNSMLKDDNSGCEILNNYQRMDIDYELETELPLNNIQSISLAERNNKWLTVLKNQMHSHSCFIAVGMRHLFINRG